MTLAEVRLWGRVVGAVSWDENTKLASFEYDPSFRESGIEIAPITMPLTDKIYSFPALPRETFHGLPGLLSDSLPDDFGNALINEWLVRKGREPGTFNPVERLCYTGNRGMGALEYAPSKGPNTISEQLDVQALVELASEIMTRRNQLKTSFTPHKRKKSLQNILRVGTSAGGARAKAIIAWNPKTNQIRSGQIKAGQEFSYWLLKFDGVSGNKDKELEDPAGYGLIEYAYYKMATSVGIEMSECRILKENNRHHFITRRFDRTDSGGKIHMQSLGAMQHFDYKKAGAYSYEQSLQTIRKLGLSINSIEQQFRRMTFNIIARNQDDHVKNIAFLMNQAGSWSLAPAFDITYSYNPSGPWTSTHQMSMNGKRDKFTLEDFKSCAKISSMTRGRAEEILHEVREAVLKWSDVAQEVGVPENVAKQIGTTHRNQFPKK